MRFRHILAFEVGIEHTSLGGCTVWRLFGPAFLLNAQEGRQALIARVKAKPSTVPCPLSTLMTPLHSYPTLHLKDNICEEYNIWAAFMI